MSDTPQGPGWWQASDGKWYSPEQAPGAAYQNPPGYGAPQPGYGAPQPGYDQPGYGAPQPGYGYGGAGGYGGGELSAGAAASYGFKKFQEHLGPILIAAVVYLLGLIAIAVVSQVIARSGLGGIVGQLVIALFQILVTSIVSIALIRATLMIVDGQPLDVNRMFSPDNLGSYLVGSLVYAVLGTIGLVLCVIPGLVFMFLAYYWSYYVIDRGMAPIDAIKASIDLVKPQAGVFLLWAILAFALSVVGFLLCLVGTLVTAPVTAIGTGYLYRRANNQPVAP